MKPQYLFSLSAASQRLGVNQHTLKRWIDEGLLDSCWVWIGKNKSRCLSERQLDALREAVSALAQGWSLKTAFTNYWTKMEQEEKNDDA
jgi:hypothetical protein